MSSIKYMPVFSEPEKQELLDLRRRFRKNPQGLFWHWVNEREWIWFQKDAWKAGPPWTDDPILSKVEFCNVRRENDGFTVKLKKLLAANHDATKPELTVFNIVVHRAFCTEKATDAIGWITDWEAQGKQLLRQLKKRHRADEDLFTESFSMCQNWRMLKKWFARAWKEAPVIAALCEAKSIEKVVRKFQAFPEYLKVNAEASYGKSPGFFAYEYATDMTYIDGLLKTARDIDSWANPGTGSRKGCNLVFRSGPDDDGDRSESDIVKEMRSLLKQSASKTKKHVPDLVARDIEHSLCEFFTYWKVLMNRGIRPSRIRKGVPAVRVG